LRIFSVVVLLTFIVLLTLLGLRRITPGDAPFIVKDS
jgi:hypothetical protein